MLCDGDWRIIIGKGLPDNFPRHTERFGDRQGIWISRNGAERYLNQFLFGVDFSRAIRARMTFNRSKPDRNGAEYLGIHQFAHFVDTVGRAGGGKLKSPNQGSSVHSQL